MEAVQRIVALSDDQLVETVASLAGSERRAIGLLVASLAELDARRLYLDLGYSSLFDYCTRALHLSEQAAYARIEAARASRRFPAIIERIMEGALSLTATRLLAPHLTADNQHEILDQARYKKTREVESIVARLRPLPPVASMVRKLPEPSRRVGISLFQPANAVPAAITDVLPVPPRSAAHRPVLQALSPTYYRLQITLSSAGHDKLREAQALSRHVVPNGDPASIVERALDVLISHLRRSKFAETAAPQARPERTAKGRYIPAAVRRAVCRRDGGRCTFVGSGGMRCEERGFLEYHHAKAYAKGGRATEDNIQLRCRAHNAHEAVLEFGVRPKP